MRVAALTLGSLSCVAMTPEQIFQVAMNAGFPPDMAVRMTAIALKESSGCPDATNIRAQYTNGPTDPGEESYGLWQINVGPRGNHTLPGRLGVSKGDLLNPDVNARAAMLLWGGSEANLDTAWYIVRDPMNKARYESFLPTALRAANNVLGTGSVQMPGTGGVTSGPEILAGENSGGGFHFGGLGMGAVVAGIAGILVLDLVMKK